MYTPFTMQMAIAQISWICIVSIAFPGTSPRAKDTGSAPEQLIALRERWRNNDTRLLPAGLMLVFAETVQATYDHSKVVATQEVIRVYHGPAEVKGMRFTIKSPRELQEGSLLEFPVYPPPPLGETGYWLLTIGNDGLQPARSGLYHVIPVTSRKYSSPTYSLMQVFAERVAELARLGESQRIMELQRLADSRVPHLAAWAIHVLGEHHAIESLPVLEHLAQQRARDEHTDSVLVERSLDEILLVLKGADWQKSDTRQQILEGWVRSPLSDAEVLWAFRHLDRIAQHPERFGIPTTQMVALVRAAAENPELSVTGRVQLISLLHWVPSRHTSDDDAFELLLDLSVHGLVPQIRRAAAGVIKSSFAPLRDERRQRIVEILPAVRDEQTELILKEASQGRPASAR